jgi:hypothetical protein
MRNSACFAVLCVFALKRNSAKEINSQRKDAKDRKARKEVIT